jgi:hypothetical protein
MPRTPFPVGRRWPPAWTLRIDTTSHASVSSHRQRLEEFAFRYWNDAINALDNSDVGDPNFEWLFFWVRTTDRALDDLWELEMRLYERDCMAANDHR